MCWSSGPTWTVLGVVLDWRYRQPIPDEFGPWAIGDPGVGPNPNPKVWSTQNPGILSVPRGLEGVQLPYIVHRGEHEMGAKKVNGSC